MPEGTGTRLIKATRKSTKPIGREPHKKSGIDDLNHRGFCVLTSFSSKVSPGRFPETSTFYGRGRREGFGEPPGGNAISCRAAAVECPARPVRTGGPAGPWSRASRPPGFGDEYEPEDRHPRARPHFTGSHSVTLSDKFPPTRVSAGGRIIFRHNVFDVNGS